jgi:catechol 2,3-dioxygenase-like lactoylglutathione lyase family enzyme
MTAEDQAGGARGLRHVGSLGAMLDHVSLQSRDVDASVGFYLAVFGPLGFREAMRYPTPAGPVVGISGPDGFPHFWLGPATDGGQRETHVAFTAPDRESVDRVYAAAQAAGAEVLHAPRLWPEYHPTYYGVFVRSPDGDNVEAVTHR